MTTKNTKLSTDNIYLLYMVPTNDLYNKRFHIIDSIFGEIYVVSIEEQLNCTCDYFNDNTNCNHLWFVMSKIFGLNNRQKNKTKYTKRQLLNLFNKIPNNVNMDVLYDDVLIDESNMVEQICNNKCPICFGNINDGNDDTDYCKYGCGKSVHIECLQIWDTFNPYNYKKCLFCKIDWEKNEYVSPINTIYENTDCLDNSEYSDTSDDDSSDWYDSEEYDDCDCDCDCECNCDLLDDDSQDIIEQLNNLTVSQLRQLCRENNLSINGNKETLINRLNDICN